MKSPAQRGWNDSQGIWPHPPVGNDSPYYFLHISATSLRIKASYTEIVSMPQKSIPSLSNKVSRITVAVLATFIGLYPLFYFFQNNFGIMGNKSSTLLDGVVWSSAFYIHITAGGLGLLVGWVQFSQRIRKSFPVIHRNVGKLYLLFALCSSASASYLALHADGGVIARLGFLCLAVVWFTSTFFGYISILRGKIDQHQEFMIFSYAACFAAVTLRILLPLLVAVYQDFIKAYVLVAWLCWLPNMFVAYLITRNMKKPENGNVWRPKLFHIK